MAKTEADYLMKIEISRLKKQGFLQSWRSGTMTWTNGFTDHKSSIGLMVSALEGDGHMQLTYTQTEYNGEKKKFDYKIPLTTMACRFGGKRRWFICPFFRDGQYCGRRVGVLYKCGDYFACRHCHNLTYHSRNENRRYKNFLLFATMTTYDKIHELEEEVKRPYYAGRPTRKQRRLDRLYKKAAIGYALLEQQKVV